MIIIRVLFLIVAPAPHYDRQSDDDKNSDQNIIGYIEKSGEILPMDAEKVASIQKPSVRNEIADNVI